MSKISVSIGTRFENMFLEDFYEFDKMESKDEIIPDFFNSKFWIEAKVGYYDFGARIKKYQIDGFKSLEEPVMYVVGFHNFPNATRRLNQKTEKARQRKLEKEMMILESYFVSLEVIENIWDKEHRISEKENIPYCMLKRRFLRNIIENNSFERYEEKRTADKYYGINREDFVLEMPKKRKNYMNYGFILNKNDRKLIDRF